jgi:SAM-dependent methyltransferase
VVRSTEIEMMEDPALPDATLRQVHRDLLRTHLWLGHVAAVERAIRRDPLPVRTVLDIGCGDGAILAELRRRLDVDVVGVDLRRPTSGASDVPILEADAVRDPLPPTDVAISICVAHHLSDEQLVGMIRNVGRSSRRLIVLDLVRHPLPAMLFRVFVAPWVHPINASDGVRSIRRAYTPGELGRLARRAVEGAGARVRLRVTPLWLRQMLEITYA